MGDKRLPLGHEFVECSWPDPPKCLWRHGREGCHHVIRVDPRDGKIHCGQPLAAHQAEQEPPDGPRWCPEHSGGVPDACNCPEEPETEPERIVAAAIRQDGVVYTGPHHHQIIRYMTALGIKNRMEGQGFVTSSNRFVHRREALLIAEAAGQPVERIAAAGDDLFSEQLWSVPDRVFLGESEPEAVPVSAEVGSAYLLAYHLMNRERDLDHGTARVEARDAAIRAEAQRDESKLREYLWLSHQHQGLYGDDGEMQCNILGGRGMCDFKRDPVQRLIDHHDAAIKEAVAFIRAEATKAERERCAKLERLLADVVSSCGCVNESSFGYFVGYKIVITRDQLEAMRAALVLSEPEAAKEPKRDTEATP